MMTDEYDDKASQKSEHLILKTMQELNSREKEQESL